MSNCNNKISNKYSVENRSIEYGRLIITRINNNRYKCREIKGVKKSGRNNCQVE